LEAFTGRTGLREAVEISREKIQTLADFWPLVSFVFDGPAEDPKAVEKIFGKDGAVETLRAAREVLATADPFDVGTLEARLGALIEARGCKPGEVYQPIRVALAGTTVSPGIFETLALLGRDDSIARIDARLARLSSDRPEDF
jgi:glutamyl-tRNA synthetase